MRKRFRFQTESSRIEEPIVNLTPLIDVVFVVLITFILIAPVLEVDSIALCQSTEVAKKNFQEGPFAINVHKDNTIWVNKTKITLKELKKLALAEKNRRPHTIPQLFHDKNAKFGTYQEVKNTLESAGFERLDVVLNPS